MTIRISYSNKGARLDGPSTGSLLTELWVAARELDWGGAMLCLLRCPAGEDDIDIGGCVLELLPGPGWCRASHPPRWWCGTCAPPSSVVVVCCHLLAAIIICFNIQNSNVNKSSFK